MKYKYLDDISLKRIKSGIPTESDKLRLQLEQLEISIQMSNDLKKFKNLFLDVFKKDI